MSEADFKAAIEATLAATNFTYKFDNLSLKIDTAKNACALADGSYWVYDNDSGKVINYNPLMVEGAWGKETDSRELENAAQFKEYATGGMSDALNAYANADYSQVTYDKDTGKYSIGKAYITFANGKVSSFGTEDVGGVEISAYGTTDVTLPDFTNAFENIVSVNIAKNAVGDKLDALTETSSYGLFSEVKNDQDYVSATANGYKQTISSKSNKGISINLANLEGKLEGYFEFSPSANGGKWDIVQIRSAGAKILSVRVSEDKSKFEIRKGNANVTVNGKENADPATLSDPAGFTVKPADNGLYKVRYTFVKDSTGNYKATLLINGQTFVSDYDLGVDTLSDIYLVSGNSGARVLTIDNVIICGTPTGGSVVNVAGITLDKYETRIETIGGTETITATVTPENATNKKLVWSSSNESVATVDATGKVTAKAKGTTTITVMAPNGKTAQCVVTVGEVITMYKVTFISEGKEVDEQTAKEGGKVLKPTGVIKEGYTVKWAVGSVNGAIFDFDTPITGNLTLYAVWEEGEDPVDPPSTPTEPGEYDPPVVTPPITNAAISHFYVANESAAIEWDENNIKNTTVEYRIKGAASYTAVDKELIRQADKDTARVDILGLKQNETYEFKITTSGGKELTESAKVSAYDRSGYAHFKYNEGVGAYNNDGTLKDNALVIYVTDANKDTVMDEICAANSDVNMFKIPYSGQGKDWGGKNASGIGWWLNNNQYTSNNEASSKSGHRPSNTYDKANGGKLGFKSVDRPIVVRFIGTVNAPEGVSEYNGWDQGGIAGDNGGMARLKNLKNVTLEGVGEDAVIKGWGFHFIAGTDAVNGQGKSFEVRNLTFSEYPEDAIGMEGQQSGGKITAGVERCWIHHNTFQPGHCANPAESDKKEGDGSCDFKRGQYFTASYNWFEYCHKTNLVGSSDSSLQYNMTYHHNVWWQCGSRIPLTRQANVHFYNNYVYGNAEEKTSPYSWVSVGLSYVHSLRANCYIFSEGNYYDGCKNVTDKTGGVAKGWGNTYYACTGTNTINNTSTRDTAVSSNCAYDGTSYSSFDTNPNLFYYDASAKKTDAYVTDSVTARKECLLFAGVQKHNYEINTSMVADKDKPAAALDIGSGLTIDVTKAAVGGTVDGVKFVTAKNSSGVAKGGKGGPLATFTLASRADITLSGEAIELVREDGYWIASGSYTGTIPAGTYLITSSEKAKEGKISTLSFKSGVTDDEKVQDVIDFINAIGEVVYTEDCKNKINAAQTAYNALSAALKAKVTNAATLTEAVNKYNGFAVAPVIEAINAIGEVDATKGVLITKARTAYDKLTAEQKKLVTNYTTLTEAEEAYKSFEVAGLQNQIDSLGTLSANMTEQQMRDLLEAYDAVRIMYTDLDEEQKDEVKNYSKVTDGITALQNALKPYDVRDMIAELPEKASVTLADSAKVSAARKAYDALDAAGKEKVGDITKLTDAEAVITKLASESKYAIFDKNKTNLASDAGFTVNGSGYKGTSDTFTYNGVEYSCPLKMQQDTTVTFNTATDMKITIYLHSGGSQIISVDGTKYTASNGVIEFELKAGSHTISKGEKEAWLCYVVLSPIA